MQKAWEENSILVKKEPDQKSTFDSEESDAKKTKSERGEDEEAQQPL